VSQASELPSLILYWDTTICPFRAPELIIRGNFPYYAGNLPPTPNRDSRWPPRGKFNTLKNIGYSSVDYGLPGYMRELVKTQ
jgi:hypothetical protein